MIIKIREKVRKSYIVTIDGEDTSLLSFKREDERVDKFEVFFIKAKRGDGIIPLVRYAGKKTFCSYLTESNRCDGPVGFVIFSDTENLLLKIKEKKTFQPAISKVAVKEEDLSDGDLVIVENHDGLHGLFFTEEGGRLISTSSLVGGRVILNSFSKEDKFFKIIPGEEEEREKEESKNSSQYYSPLPGADICPYCGFDNGPNGEYRTGVYCGYCGGA